MIHQHQWIERCHNDPIDLSFTTFENPSLNGGSCLKQGAKKICCHRWPKAPFSNHFVQLCHSYAGPHEEAKLPQGPNGTARITAGPVPWTGGEMSGIGI